MFFFRIDLGSKSGLGHLKRIQSLIKYLDISNYKIVVDHKDDLKHLDNKEKNNFIVLYNNSLFISEINDAKIFLSLIKKYKKKVYVVKDSYRFGHKWEKLVSNYVKKLIVISDSHDEKHYADFYINHNPRFTNLNKNEYNNFINKNKKNCKFLLGSKFSLFNFNYINKNKIYSDLFFYNGGSGNLLIYEKIIKQIIKENKGLKIVILIGPYAHNHQKVYEKFKNYKSIKIVYKIFNISNYLKGTKLFISSTGISMFESSFIKLPTLLFKINENQNLLDNDCEKLGHFFLLNKKDLKNTHKVTKLIFLMLKNINQIKKMMSLSKIELKNIKLNFKKHLKDLL